MSYRKSELGLMMQVNEQAARARIVEAYRKAEGYVPAAASILGVGARSLVRWTTELDLRKEVDKIRVDNRGSIRAPLLEQRPSHAVKPRPQLVKKKVRRTK